MNMWINFLLILILNHLQLVDGSPGGAPAPACQTMSPTAGHGGVAQTQCSPDFQIISNRTNYNNNEPVEVIIQAVNPGSTFRGILMMAFAPNSTTPIGTWSTSSADLKSLNCFNTANSAMTHTSRSDKNQVKANWIPPTNLVNTSVTIRTTIVREFSTYYVGCYNLNISIQQSNQLTNGTATTSGSTNVPNTLGSTTTTTTAPTIDVGVNVIWTFSNGVTMVQMVVTNLKASQWAAVGLSQDMQMGEDHVFVCQRLSDNTVKVLRMINIGKAPPVAVAADSNGGLFTVTGETFEDGSIRCSFTLSDFTSKKRERRQATIPSLSQTASYYPLIAIGDLSSSNSIRKHFSQGALSQSVQLNRNTNFNYNLDDSDDDRVRLMKAHGIIMLFTWILFASTGILVAQFFKTAWPGRKIFGKAVWFNIHRPLMILAWLLTIIAFILILIYKKGKWVPTELRKEFAHSITGILVISFAVIQPFMALIRPEPDAPRRFIFNYAHGFVGYSALLLSIVTLFLAMFFTQFNFEESKEWAILVAWVCWVFVIFLLFTLIELFYAKKSSSVREESHDLGSSSNNPQSNPRRQTPPNPKRDLLKTVLLVIHILVACGLSIGLAIVIGRI